MQQATLVDTGGGRIASTVRDEHTVARRMMPHMQSIAAYYVIVAADLANQPRRHDHVVSVRPSLSARIAAVLARRSRPARRAVSQPA